MRLADMLREDTTPEFDGVRKALARATPFEISADVGRMAALISSRNSTAKIAEIMPFCRVPFHAAWFEWRGASADYKPEGPIYHPDKPERFGVLYLVDGADHAKATLVFAWGSRGVGVNVCPFAAKMDWSDNPSISDDMRITPVDLNLQYFRETGTFKNDSDEDIRQLIKRGAIVINPLMRGYWTQLLVASRGRKVPQDVVQSWADDINGEPAFAEALLAVVNSRNLVKISDDDQDLTKINRARVKRGKPPMLQFRKVTVSLSRGATARSAKSGDGSIPLHVVRGHFKVRKSGIYWWSPFWRGDAAAGVVSRSGYRVET
jgi:hypothetical protein